MFCTRQRPINIDDKHSCQDHKVVSERQSASINHLLTFSCTYLCVFFPPRGFLVNITPDRAACNSLVMDSVRVVCSQVGLQKMKT